MLHGLCAYIDQLNDGVRRKLVLEKLGFILSFGSNSANWPLEGLLHAIQSLMGFTPRNVIILDGFEEHDDVDESRRLFRYLSSLCRRRLANVMVFSQPMAWSHELEDPLWIHMDYGAMRPQLFVFLKTEMDCCETLKTLEPAVIHAVLDKSEATFLGVSLLLEDLKNADTQLQQKEILARFSNEVLNTLRKQVGDTTRLMTTEDRVWRQKMFEMLAVARRPLSIEELASLLVVDTTTNSINDLQRLLDPRRKILYLGDPLINLVGQEIHFKHSTARECLIPQIVDLKAAEEDLALRTLSILMEDPYNTWQYASTLLRRNLLPGNLLATTANEMAEKVEIDYNYACLHWFEHVIRVPTPSNNLVEKLVSFLRENAFVTWSEVFFDLKGRISMAAQAVVLRALLPWVNGLPEDMQMRISIDDFFEGPHKSLSQELFEKDDTLPPYLPLWRIGQYLDNNGSRNSQDVERAFNYKEQVARGFGRILGASNPLTLR